MLDDVPFRYVQLDSWWYWKGTGNGVKNWTAMNNETIFPNGIESLQSFTKWPIAAHNRYWSPNTDYAKQNGGKYKFVVEQNLALPDDPSFWDFLLSTSRSEWGLIMYEQDWLSTVWDSLKAIRTDVNLGRNWLLEMGLSAQRNGLTIQYCMAYPRHFLQTLEIPVVTQIRVSTDYHQSNSQWKIGDSSMLAWALGLSPFKDDFRSTALEQRCGNHDIEQWPILETVVATLSTGPVGPSDRIGQWDPQLLKQTCQNDGKILKPSYPALSIDSTFTFRAFQTGGPDGQVWDSVSVIDGFIFHQIFAAELNSDYILNTLDLIDFTGTGEGLAPSLAYSLGGGSLQPFNGKQPLKLVKCGKSDFQLYHSTPIFNNNWALLGELSKIVHVSPQRILNIDVRKDGVDISLQGVPQEVIIISFAVAVNNEWQIKSWPVAFPDSGLAFLSVP